MTNRVNNVPDLNAGGGVTGRRPNIKFIGRRTWDRDKKKVLKDPQPIEKITIGRRTIELPAADFQKGRRLFYHSDAREIARRFPKLYKLVQNKNGEFV